MERSLQTLKKHISSFVLALCALLGTFSIRADAQEPSQKDRIRIQIWSELDPFPGKFDGSDSETRTAAAPTITEDGRDITIYRFAIDRAKEIAPFLIGGMLDGWTFDYVPYDKTRRVDEYFEFGEIRPFDSSVNTIAYREPQPVDDRLLCWVECDRTPAQELSYERWASITHPKVRGHGSAPVENGFEAIQEACSEALKNAVREYWRTQTKNKPKEILGRVLLIQNPRIYISEGRYIVDLDFFLETDKIVTYRYY